MQLTVKTMLEKSFLEKIYVFKYKSFFKYEFYNKTINFYSYYTHCMCVCNICV